MDNRNREEEIMYNCQTEEQLELQTKLSALQRKTLINWFNKQNVEFQIIIFDEQKNQFFKLKNENVEQKFLPLASFLLAIKIFYGKEQLLKSKNKTQSLCDLAHISRQEVIKNKRTKQKPKLQMLLTLHSVIVKLYENDYSIRDIQKYLQSKHRKSVSHTYLGEYINKYVKGGES